MPPVARVTAAGDSLPRCSPKIQRRTTSFGAERCALWISGIRTLPVRTEEEGLQARGPCWGEVWRIRCRSPCSET